MCNCLVNTRSISNLSSHTVVAQRTYLNLLFPKMSLNRCMDALLNIPPTWSGSRTKGWWGFSILLAIRYNTPPSLVRRLHLVWTLRSFNVARQQKADKCIVRRFRKEHKIPWHWLVNRYEKGQSLCKFCDSLKFGRKYRIFNGGGRPKEKHQNESFLL